MKKNLLLALFSIMLMLISYAQTITKGCTVKILEIAQSDSYYSERANLVGKNATVLGEFTKGNDGFYSGTLETTTGRTIFFTDVKVSLVKAGPADTKSTIASKDLFTGSIPSGTRFVILEVPSDDAYFSDRKEIEGKTGTASKTYTLDKDGYTSGNVETDDGKSYYFYKVRLGKTDTKAPVKSSSSTITKLPTFITGTIKKGTVVYVADISPDDSYYSDRYKIVGKKGKIIKDDMKMKEDGFYAGDFEYDDGSTTYFYKAKFSKDPVPALEKPSDYSDDDLYAEWDDAVNDPDVEEGDNVEIVAVSPDDSYYEDRYDYIGKKGVITNIEYDDFEDGYGGDIKLENGKSMYFYLVKLKKISSGTPSRASSGASSKSSGNDEVPAKKNSKRYKSNCNGFRSG